MQLTSFWSSSLNHTPVQGIFTSLQFGHLTQCGSKNELPSHNAEHWSQPVHVYRCLSTSLRVIGKHSRSIHFNQTLLMSTDRLRHVCKVWIGNALNVSRTTVSRWIIRYKETGDCRRCYVIQLDRIVLIEIINIRV